MKFNEIQWSLKSYFYWVIDFASQQTNNKTQLKTVLFVQMQMQILEMFTLFAAQKCANCLQRKLAQNTKKP